MNDNVDARLSSMETSLKFISKDIKAMKEDIEELKKLSANITTNLVKRESINGFHDAELSELKQRYTTLEEDVDALKRYAWIAFGVIACLQFVIPIVLKFV